MTFGSDTDTASEGEQESTDRVDILTASEGEQESTDRVDILTASEAEPLKESQVVVQSETPCTDSTVNATNLPLTHCLMRSTVYCHKINYKMSWIKSCKPSLHTLVN